MEEDVATLHAALVAEVNQIKDEYAYPDLGRAFQHWSAVNVLGLEDKDVADELTSAMGPDYGIDYLYNNIDDKTVEIVQAKFSKDYKTEVGPKAIMEFYDIPHKLLTHTVENDSHFHDQQQIFKESKEKNYATRLLFVTASNLSMTAKELIKLKNQNLSTDTIFEVLEIKDLIAYVGNPKSQQCDLKVFEKECFISKHNSNKIKKTVFTVKASEIKKIFESIGFATLFSLNPRSFLGQGKISKNIMDTIQSAPDRLWHYNNGISAVCERFEYNEKTGILKIDNLKIVNGCQTVTTIGKTKEVNPDAMLVFRLTETSDSEFSENISKYTNQQNSIAIPDLRSNHQYLISLEKRFGPYEKFTFERKKGKKPTSAKPVQSRRSLYEIKSLSGARLKMAYMGKPHLSMQLAQDKLFSDVIIDDNGSELKPFSRLYKDADPRDFIIPNVFYYWLNTIKNNLAKNNSSENDQNAKNIKYLLKYKIGQYYIIGIIGKIFNDMPVNRKDRLMDAIIDVSIKYDPDIVEEVIKEVTNLVDWVAHTLPEVLGEKSGTRLDGKPVYYLRDPLRAENKLLEIYSKRENLCKFQGRPDPFKIALCKILGVMNT